MAEFEPREPDVHVNGRLVRSVVDAVSDLSGVYETRTEQVLAREGISDPAVGEWYPQDAWLTAFEETTAMVGRDTVRRIGREIAASADWPADLEGFCEALALMNRLHEANHRGEQAGEYRCQSVDGCRAKVISTTPVPCPYDRGMLRAIADEVTGEDADVDVSGEGRCRSDGDDQCWYVVTW
jgi:predicted hydrocarbon binding protein